MECVSHHRYVLTSEVFAFFLHCGCMSNSWQYGLGRTRHPPEYRRTPRCLINSSNHLIKPSVS